MRFRIGDRVRIKEKFWEVKKPDDAGTTPDMRKLEGCETTIKGILPGGIYFKNNTYTFEEVAFNWEDHWLEPAYEPPVKDFTEDEFMAILEG